MNFFQKKAKKYLEKRVKGYYFCIRFGRGLREEGIKKAKKN